MKLLHTADWHVGKEIGGRSRRDEFAAALDAVVRIATDEAVDAVLVAGDLFDRRAPSAEAEELVYATLARLGSARIPVALIPGNHDEPLRFGALAPLFAPLGVRAVTSVAPPEEGSVLEIPARDGSERALVACVPFVAEHRLASASANFAGAEKWAQEYAQGMGDLLGAMALAFRPHCVNVLLAHLFMTQVELGGGENSVHVQFDYAVSPARLPGTATYIALGHVHRAQAIPGSPAPARYAGSLLQLDFGEVAQRKSVTVIEASPGKPARVREVPLAAGRALLDVAGTLDELRARAASFGDAWLRVTLAIDAPVPGISDQVRALLPHAVQVRLALPRAPEDALPAGLVGLTPREQFLAYYRATHGADPASELVAAFAEVEEALQSS